jgi:hypothetical protein
VDVAEEGQGGRLVEGERVLDSFIDVAVPLAVADPVPPDPLVAGGLVLVLDFPTRQELDAWLKIEPYVLGDVWRRIDVQPFRVGPSFTGLHR